ncbi:type II toxin-antitoxin system death-on-curing family toxin [Bosea rubneri]|jgi:death on curing protein|uniref:Type II toxin-antitoxin system death-on-curing family toxin n=1 Tax=Bosea rubneri TaxID=3075434 RepID=A0ABU3S904_9HYPH|nr:type II toxin-antitoxin system death-on-curing family toxin [Bosea sp. ZW T0_25]MDU0340872.1 type II toxin-antitoxin system death-on-curing family toxin [Bosea sp. ZW T0_25]
MTEPLWLTSDVVADIHSEQLALFGGPDGIRDLGLLESALARPLNRFAYGERDLAVLAAAYAFGIARNHPFVDGNKRVSLLTLIIFLRLNGIAFAPSEADAAAIILALAAGEVDEEGLSRWIRDNWPKDTPA